jgi:hypothetical protein
MIGHLSEENECDHHCDGYKSCGSCTWEKVRIFLPKGPGEVAREAIMRACERASEEWTICGFSSEGSVFNVEKTATSD